MKHFIANILFKKEMLSIQRLRNEAFNNYFNKTANKYDLGRKSAFDTVLKNMFGLDY